MTAVLDDKTNLILVDDDPHIREAAGQTLELEGYEVATFANAEDALAAISEGWGGVVISDINLPGMSGLELQAELHQRDPQLPVIMITGHGDISMAVNAIRNGAYDFIEKPFPSDLLIDVVRRAIETRRLTLENRALKEEIATHNMAGPRIIGNASGIQRLRQLVKNLADAPTDILIHAETGSGKDMLARYIHETSNRRGANFVAINCGAVPETLIESELFGHEAGAFTDAKSRRIGKFEHANGGTLFFDEIESMSVAMQVKLLRALEERTIERLGSNQSIPLDIRVIAASKSDLKALAERGDFREDLYYRLNVVRLDIPPLRDRREDIPLLFKHFSLVASGQYGREVAPLPTEQMQALVAHNWPGNVRELRNLAERYVLLGDACDFDLGSQELPAISNSTLSLPQRVENFEKMLIQNELERHAGSIKETLNTLGVPRKTLYDKMRKYALDKADYK